MNAKAMWLRNIFVNDYRGYSADKMIRANHKLWLDLTNEERTYVLTGREKKNEKK
jgi:hypothetical protein